MTGDPLEARPVGSAITKHSLAWISNHNSDAQNSSSLKIQENLRNNQVSIEDYDDKSENKSQEDLETKSEDTEGDFEEWETDNEQTAFNILKYRLSILETELECVKSDLTKYQEENRRLKSQRAILEDNSWLEDLTPRLELMVLKLKGQRTLSYAQLISEYTKALIPEIESLEIKPTSRFKSIYTQLNRPCLQLSIPLHFMQLRRIRILDLQIQIREGVNFLCSRKFGKDFDHSNLAKWQQTMQDCDDMLDTYERTGKLLQADFPWKKQLLYYHTLLLQVFDEKQSTHATTIDEVLDRGVFAQSSLSGLISPQGTVWFIIRYIQAFVGNQEAPDQPIHYLWKEIKTLCLRITIGIIGGLAIITPMLIMSINSSKTKDLVTTSVCVFFFAVLLGFSRKQSNGELLAGTAAYAAVLVVFIGTNEN
ncbi:hypothetical protein G7Y89_g2354 [Cudoniella acicularis]|uniref:DUF6594 domain-containing protein n=1 Tax=Cudoniella acicularis TaxID=354080 RepID=A0A8H4RV87_9HELO|nr:hypothetical protein G7Y89_g2354 [Cudoniella acicularis]